MPGGRLRQRRGRALGSIAGRGEPDYRAVPMRGRLHATLLSACPVPRRRFAAALAVLAAAAVSAPGAVRADQHQDWMVEAPEAGPYAVLDFIFGAVQAGVEDRIPVYGKTNMLTVRGSAIAALPFGSTQADVDMRIVNLTLGMSVGAASVWRNQSFALDAPMNRKERRQREAAGAFNTDTYGFWEGRASIAFPLNDYVLFNQVNAVRISGAENRSFDNLVGVVDDGDSVRSDFQLFFKHPRVGALAPMFQILNFQLDNDWKTQLNYGFMFVTRAGLVRRDDLIMLQMLFTSGPIFGAGIDNRDVYGSAPFRGPYTFLLVYRSQIAL